MKTAIQRIIDNLEYRQEIAKKLRDGTNDEGMKFAYSEMFKEHAALISQAKSMLPEEQKQIETAFRAGIIEGDMLHGNTPENYFTTTYNKD